jgi:hypothetical protein
LDELVIREMRLLRERSQCYNGWMTISRAPDGAECVVFPMPVILAMVHTVLSTQFCQVRTALLLVVHI